MKNKLNKLTRLHYFKKTKIQYFLDKFHLRSVKVNRLDLMKVNNFCLT